MKIMSFQTGVNYFLLLTTKEDILKNVGNQTVLATIHLHRTDLNK